MAYKMMFSKADCDSEIDGGVYREWEEESFEKVEKRVKRFKRDHPNAHVYPINNSEGQKIGEGIEYWCRYFSCTLEYYEKKTG